MAKEQSEKKKKRPTALKRDIQNAKRKLQNRIFKSRVHTSIRSFKEALAKGDDADSLKKKLSDVYSHMDKGVKRGIFKKNKAARVKSHLTARAAAK